jgi:selenocysteine lyase/cysteine desulfurase
MAGRCSIWTTPPVQAGAVIEALAITTKTTTPTCIAGCKTEFARDRRLRGCAGKVARYLGAGARTKCLHARDNRGINLVANTWGAANQGWRCDFAHGDEHYSNLVPAASRGRPATLRFVPVADDGSLALDGLANCSRPR